MGLIVKGTAATRTFLNWLLTFVPKSCFRSKLAFGQSQAQFKSAQDRVPTAVLADFSLSNLVSILRSVLVSVVSVTESKTETENTETLTFNP